MAELVVTAERGEGAWRKTLVEGTVIRLGRGPRNGWSVPWDPLISREHADLRWEKGKLLVRALPSARNPIYFQGEANTEFLLVSGDEFRIGKTLFRIEGQRSLGDSSAPPPPDIDSFGKYKIVRKIGAGGMGTVYLATDTVLRRTVALKVLAPEFATDDTVVQRFYLEAQSTAQLLHDNIVTIFDAGQAEDVLYLALEYVDGTDVLNLIEKGGQVSEQRSVDIIRQTALALAHAQQRGLVHRDIKPSNLLIRRDGRVKLTDMGLARSIDDATGPNITREGMIVGTANYIAPEQASDSQAADFRSDIYSLGCTWYHMLTGSPPFPTDTFMQTLYAHSTEPMPDPRAKNPAVSSAAVLVLHRMARKEPDDRYQSFADLIHDLDQLNPAREGIDDGMVGGSGPSADRDKDTVRRNFASTSETDKQTLYLSVECPNCGGRYKLKPAAAGRRFICRKCESVVAVPTT